MKKKRGKLDSYWLIDWLLLNVITAIFQLYHCENKSYNSILINLRWSEIYNFKYRIIVDSQDKNDNRLAIEKSLVSDAFKVPTMVAWTCLELYYSIVL